MSELSEQELLLLDNLMYSDEMVKKDNRGRKIKDVIEDMRDNHNFGRLSGGFDEGENGRNQYEDILKEIQSDSKLCSLTIGESTSFKKDNIKNNDITATCFVDFDKNAVVAFRGTGGKVPAWQDNFVIDVADTELQEKAVHYIKEIF